MTDEEIIRRIAGRVRQRLAAPGPALPASDEHPSRRQFNIGEAVDAVREIVDFLEAQRCTIEKDKPCDHCGMCRSLGF
ncbi:MAG: hypothetical protein KF868_15925 [Acidobacteria bacterium]|nr:hypothetical protein [Acidobacteriota bacterium]MCW5971224.1 hypothetical protein [Blastocatellales bacterium]